MLRITGVPRTHSVPIALGAEFLLQMSLSVQATGTVGGEGAEAASITAMNSFERAAFGRDG